MPPAPGSRPSRSAARIARPQRELGEGTGCGRERATIAACVGDEEDRVIGPAVATLQRKPALRRLQIVKDGFRLDRKAPTRSPDHGVPGAQVALDRERHLGRPVQARMEARPKSLEEPNLAGVPDRVAGRVGAQSDVQPDGCRHGRKCPHIDCPGDARLDAPCRRAGDAARGTDVVLAQPGIASSRGDVGAHAPVVICDPTTRAIQGTRPGTNALGVWRDPLRCRSRRPSFAVHASDAANDGYRADPTVSGAGFRGSVAIWRSGRVKQRSLIAPTSICRVRRTTAGQQPAEAGPR
jgi:hypothetical protein